MSQYVVATANKLENLTGFSLSTDFESSDSIFFYDISLTQVQAEELNSIVKDRMAKGISIALLPRGLKIKAFFFDMDGTFIDQETINELAAHAGKLEGVAGITERAMRGEIEFAEALQLRVALLEGLSKDIFSTVLADMTLTEGMQELLDYLSQKNIPYYLISGGFDFFAGAMAKKYGFKLHKANLLEQKNGRLTGKIEGSIVDAEAKKNFLNEICLQIGIQNKDIAAMGDGANDIPMLREAQLAIGFNARPKLFDHINVYYQKSHHFLLEILKKMPLC